MHLLSKFELKIPPSYPKQSCNSLPFLHYDLHTEHSFRIEGQSFLYPLVTQAGALTFNSKSARVFCDQINRNGGMADYEKVVWG